MKILKLASTLHAAAGDPDLTEPPWAPISKLTTNWNNCLPVTKTDTICQDIRAVRAMFQANYDNYKALYPKTKKCDPDIDPVKLTEDLIIAHVYGFTPFNENCTEERFNLLENTPGYDANKSEKFHQVKTTFDELNYWKDGSFNPYVGLVHGADYINAPNTYAYSVDDAVGNLQADGSGFVIAVGGTRGLPNANPASPPVNVNFGGSSVFGDWIRWGVCTTDPDKMRPVTPNFRSFAFYVQKENLSQCLISLLAKWKPGGEEVVYSFKLKTLDFTYEFDPKNPITPKTHAPIDCSGLKPIPAALCKDIYAYAEHGSCRCPDPRYAIVPALYPHDGAMSRRR